jgi:allophanate hydrolase
MLTDGIAPSIQGGLASHSLTIHDLKRDYRDSSLTPSDVSAEVIRRVQASSRQGVWLALKSPAELEERVAQVSESPMESSLWGIPFAVKDNIDVAGMETTAASPEFSYVADTTATVVSLLEAQGAILVGKTNLDQFATGLSGARSPYAIPQAAVGRGMIAGGSSSGSAVAVGLHHVSFALGTDTAGSGRVPAGFNGVVGVKPSRGLVSTSGLVPACRSLDCPSVFAQTVADGAEVLHAIAGRDESDPWSRELPVPSGAVAQRSLKDVRLAVPNLDTWHDIDAVGYSEVWHELMRALRDEGANVVQIDMGPFFAAGRLLYDGAWIAERMSAVQPFLDAHADVMEPSVRTLLQRGHDVTGADVFRGWDELMGLRVEAAIALEGFDALVTPTAPTTFTIEQMLADPIVNNAVLGRFTTFTNLLDLAVVSVPAGETASGLPFGVSIQGKAGTDSSLASLASALHALIVPASEPPSRAAIPHPPADSPSMRLTVVGAHLRGMPLHSSLIDLGATWVRDDVTAPEYRLYALADTAPAKPGLVRVGPGGAAIEVEVYDVPLSSIGPLLATVTAPLGLGEIALADGSRAHGFLCEARATASAVDISGYGGWRAYSANTAIAPDF